MDITKTTEPKSDQQNYDDYMTSPRTVTISEVKAGSAEQPVEVHLVEFPGRPYKPSKSMRRVLVACWGPEAAAYAGRRMTLFGDASVRFGGQAVGGIRIGALSHLNEPKTIPLTVTRGKREPFTVQPIPVDTGEHLAALTAATTVEQLQAAWQAATKAGVATQEAVIELKDARKAELTAPVLDPADPNYVEADPQ